MGEGEVVGVGDVVAAVDLDEVGVGDPCGGAVGLVVWLLCPPGCFGAGGV